MKPYRVYIEYRTVILAESREQAEKRADFILRNESDDPPEDVTASVITSEKDLPDGWTLDARPWGERDPLDRTIGQILKPETAPSLARRKEGV